jgi:hypothetical protein
VGWGFDHGERRHILNRWGRGYALHFFWLRREGSRVGAEENGYDLVVDGPRRALRQDDPARTPRGPESAFPALIGGLVSAGGLLAGFRHLGPISPYL